MSLRLIVNVFVWGTCFVVAQPPPICYRAQMPNEADEFSFYKCDASGQAHLWRCAPGTIYDRVLEICNWEDAVRGRNDGTVSQNSTNGNSTRRGGVNNGGWAENEGFGWGNVNRFANEYPLEGPGALGEDRPDWEGGDPWEIPRHRQQEMQEQQRQREVSRIEQQRQFHQTQFQLQAQAPPTQQSPLTPAVRNTGIVNGMACLASDIQPRMYMNPDDCSTYFTCNMGRPVLTYCLRGHYFNPERRGCDDQVHPGCSVVEARVEVLGVTEVEGAGLAVEGARTSGRSSRRRNRVRTEAIVGYEPAGDDDVDAGQQLSEAESEKGVLSNPLAALPDETQVEIVSSKENEIPVSD